MLFQIDLPILISLLWSIMNLVRSKNFNFSKFFDKFHVTGFLNNNSTFTQEWIDFLIVDKIRV